MTTNTRTFAGKALWITLILSGSFLAGASLTHSQETAADAHPEFPAGPGRDVTLATCSKCHSPNNILAMGRDRQGWQELILKMVDLGAQGTDEDFTTILDYLSKSFPVGTVPHVNVNTATAPQIATVLTLTTEEAKEIVDYRDKNGKFKTLDDLKKVPKVDPKKLEARKDSVLF